MYQLGNKNFWQGRQDTEDGNAGLRWHQIINILDVTANPLHKAGADLNIAFLGFCCDEGVRRNKGRVGAQNGPDAIRKAMASLPIHFSTNSIALFDAGNIICPNQDMERAQQMLGDKVFQLLTYGFLPIVLGGGHEVAFGHYLGLHQFTKNTVGSALGILNIDAHFDLRPYTQESSSGTPFRQIWDLRKHHGLDFNYLCLGIQEASNTQALFNQAQLSKTSYLLAQDLIEFDTISRNAYLNKWLQDKGAIYLTLDLDVLSADVAPGVSATNPYGISTKLTLEIIDHLIKSGKIISLDIAELNPNFDIDNRTAKWSAWCIFSIVQQFSKLFN